MSPNQKNVLQVYQDYYPRRGGIEDHVRTLCRSLPGHIDSAVLTSSNSPATRFEEVEGIPVLRLGSWGRWYTPFCPAMPRTLRTLPADIIHIHIPCPVAELSFLLANPDRPLAVSYHNDIIRPRVPVALYRPFLRAFLRRAARILVSSEAYLRTSPDLREFAGKCELAPYGIEVEAFVPTEPIMAQAARIRAECGKPIVLFVGRLCYYKGLEHLIPAMRGMDAALVIAGAGPLEGSLRRIAAGVDADIRFAGVVSDAARAAYYHASEVVVLPSTLRSEAFGLVQVQAQACARAVITTDLPGVSGVTIHDETGLVVPPGSAEAIRGAIITLLGDDRLREKMGRAGHARALENYQAGQMAQRVSGIYEQIC